MIVPTTSLYRERLEYASYNARERRHTWTIRLLCRDCVDEVARLHRGELPPGAQRVLFP